MTISGIAIDGPSQASHAYDRLVNCINSNGGAITLPDDDLFLAACEAVDYGFITTARVALRELRERQEVAA